MMIFFLILVLNFNEASAVECGPTSVKEGPLWKCNYDGCSNVLAPDGTFYYYACSWGFCRFLVDWTFRDCPIPRLQCSLGFYASGGGTCLPCPDNSFCSDPSLFPRSCSKSCSSNAYYIKTPCNKTSDMVCVPCSVCAQGTIMTKACSGNSDTVCTQCGDACPETIPTQYIQQIPSSVSLSTTLIWCGPDSTQGIIVRTCDSCTTQCNSASNAFDGNLSTYWKPPLGQSVYWMVCGFDVPVTVQSVVMVADTTPSTTSYQVQISDNVQYSKSSSQDIYYYSANWGPTPLSLSTSTSPKYINITKISNESFVFAKNWLISTDYNVQLFQINELSLWRWVCPPTYQLASPTHCTACQAGMYSTAYFATSCLACAAGTFSQARASTCNVCDQCVNGSYMMSPCNASSNTLCIKCSAGFYSFNGSRCTVCPSGFSSTEGSSSCTACPAGIMFAPGVGRGPCQNCSSGCPLGSMMTTPCNATADIACIPCPNSIPGLFVYTSAGCDQFTCLPGYMKLNKTCVTCQAGTFSSSPSAACTRCAAGTFAAAIASTTCTACSVCSGGFYSSVNCTPVSDTVCSACTSCVSGSTYETTACTNTLNRVCAACSSCVLGSTFMVSACNLSADIRCSSCSTCVAGITLQKSACNASSNTVCIACSRCPIGSYINTPCSLTSDTTCNPCSSCVAGITYQTSACNASANAVCAACSTCSRGSYTSTPCSLTSDAVCSPCSSCGGGTYQKSVCNVSSDNVCIPCSSCMAGITYQTSACNASADTVCTACTACSRGSYYASAPCSLTSDAVCSPCSSCVTGSNYSFVACNASTNTVCRACTVCPTGYITGAACTNTSNTVCVVCPANHYCNTSVAVPCPNGTYSWPGATNASQCMCPANHYCNTSAAVPCPNGTYSWPGATNASQCMCPANASVLTGKNNCTCNAGFRHVIIVGNATLGGWTCELPASSYVTFATVGVSETYYEVCTNLSFYVSEFCDALQQANPSDTFTCKATALDDEQCPCKCTLNNGSNTSLLLSSRRLFRAVASHSSSSVHMMHVSSIHTAEKVNPPAKAAWMTNVTVYKTCQISGEPDQWITNFTSDTACPSSEGGDTGNNNDNVGIIVAIVLAAVIIMLICCYCWLRVARDNNRVLDVRLDPGKRQ